MLSAFSVSVLLFGFGGGPLILAPMSETFGRKPIYTVCFTIFTLSQIGCALSINIGMLIGFRFLAGFFGSASISNGGGTISDLYDALERTRVVGWYLLGPLMGTLHQVNILIKRPCHRSRYWRFHDRDFVLAVDILVNAHSQFDKYSLLRRVFAGDIRPSHSR